MPGSKEEVVFYWNNAFLLNDIWPCPSARTPAQGVMKVTILVDPSLVIITIYLVCLINVLEERRKFLKGIMHFHYMTYMATP